MQLVALSMHLQYPYVQLCNNIQTHVLQFTSTTACAGHVQAEIKHENFTAL